MNHINDVLAFTNKLREIGKPTQELHIINIILSSPLESYARARSNWNTIPVVERTVINLTGKIKAVEKIIACYSKPIQNDTALHASGPTNRWTNGQIGKNNSPGDYHNAKRKITPVLTKFFNNLQSRLVDHGTHRTLRTKMKDEEDITK
jgi:hypothetical protein